MSLAKVRAGLATSGARQAKRLAFLVLPGSFSPVHTQHLRALEIARHVMLDIGWYVIGGFLAPSGDQYVISKIGSNAWPLSRRLELCRLATDHSPWIGVTPWAEFGSFRAVRRLQHAIESVCREDLRARQLEGVLVMGSDTALRILRGVLRDWNVSTHDSTTPPRDQERWVCCLPRPGGKGTADIEELTGTIEPRLDPLGIRIVVGSDYAHPLLDVSSQAIRKAIERREWDKLRDGGWLNPKVMERLRSADG